MFGNNIFNLHLPPQHCTSCSFWHLSWTPDLGQQICVVSLNFAYWISPFFVYTHSSSTTVSVFTLYPLTYQFKISECFFCFKNIFIYTLILPNAAVLHSSPKISNNNISISVRGNYYLLKYRYLGLSCLYSITLPGRWKKSPLFVQYRPPCFRYQLLARFNMSYRTSFKKY